jgi:hypothetical protein
MSFTDAVSYWDYMTWAIQDFVWLIGGMILTRKTPKNFDEILSQCNLVNHKSHNNLPGTQNGPFLWQADD